MLRLIIDLFIGINAVGGVVGYTLKRYRRNKRIAHADYIRQLEAENLELDAERKRIEKGAAR